jgi:hypothetical protein
MNNSLAEFPSQKNKKGKTFKLHKILKILKKICTLKRQ